MSKKANKRKSISKALREQIWKMTNGRCHICSKRLRKNAKAGEYGRWHIGHIIAHKRGGQAVLGNILLTCRDCNLTLKHSGCKRIKKLLRLGVWTEYEIKKKTDLGKKLALLYRNRKKINLRNRR